MCLHLSRSDNHFLIILRAKNNGRTARQGYFSISFPIGVEGESLTISTDANRKMGKKYESWCDGRVVLSYPIAEGYMGHDRPVWRSYEEHYIKVQGDTNRKGLVRFYVNAG